MAYTCSNCGNFHPAKKECRKHPPVRLPRKFDEVATAGNRMRDETLIWGWPKVLPDDWCGDHEYIDR